MRNAIKYYYNIDVTQIDYFDDYYLFDNFMLKEIKDSINFDIYNLIIQYNIKIHKIIVNIFGLYYTKINNKNYVLYELCEYNEITLNEIIDYSNKLSMINLSNLKINDFVKLWKNKTDYYEKMFYVNDNTMLNEAFPYFIGLSELSIRIYNEFKKNISYRIVHRRIKSFYDFYCPDNFIIDSVTREYSEFLKTQFFIYNNNVEYIIDFVFANYHSINECLYFFSRICFPSYFYDYINNFKLIKRFISKINKFEILLDYISNKIQNLYGLEIIYWIKKI